MTQHLKIFNAGTGGVLTRIQPGASEAELWQQLVTDGMKGRLEDSNGIMVTKFSVRIAKGDYRFFAEAAGRQMPWQACIALTL